jgi:hypothetical protein
MREFEMMERVGAAVKEAETQLVPTITEGRIPPLFGFVSQKNGFRRLSDAALHRFWVLVAVWEEALGRKLTDVEQDRQWLILRVLATAVNRLRAPSGGKMDRRMDRERFQ